MCYIWNLSYITFPFWSLSRHTILFLLEYELYTLCTFETRSVRTLFLSEFWDLQTFCLLEKFELYTVCIDLSILKLLLYNVFYESQPVG